MATRLLDLGCSFRYQAGAPTAALFHVVPRATPGVILRNESFTTNPGVDVHRYVDTLGNDCRRLLLPWGVTTVSYSAQAIVPDAVDDSDPEAPESLPGDLPDDTLVFTLPSRFCQSDVMAGLAWRLFGGLTPGYQRVKAICSWTHDYLTYTAGSTNALSTAVDAYTSGHGVCRDYAHLMITMCRALNIPARYVSGYLPDMDVPPLPTPMDFHAFVEVWLGDRWYSFDPRHDALRKGRVVICYGRDASDTPLAMTYGAPWLQQLTVVCEEAAG